MKEFIAYGVSIGILVGAFLIVSNTPMTETHHSPFKNEKAKFLDGDGLPTREAMQLRQTFGDDVVIHNEFVASRCAKEQDAVFGRRQLLYADGRVDPYDYDWCWR